MEQIVSRTLDGRVYKHRIPYKEANDDSMRYFMEYIPLKEMTEMNPTEFRVVKCAMFFDHMICRDKRPLAIWERMKADYKIHKEHKRDPIGPMYLEQPDEHSDNYVIGVDNLFKLEFKKVKR